MHIDGGIDVYKIQYGVDTAQNRRRLGWNSVRSAKKFKLRVELQMCNK